MAVCWLIVSSFSDARNCVVLSLCMATFIVQSEENERKLMEREEKLARLLLKVLHRRSKEGKIKKQSAEQQREERERIAMARDERQTRLFLKLAGKQTSGKKRSINVVSSGAAPATRVRARSKAEGPATGKSPTSVTSTASDPQDDDDSDDLSFLNIDFKIPASMQRVRVAPTSVRAQGGSSVTRMVRTSGQANTNMGNNSNSGGRKKTTKRSAKPDERTNQEELAMGLIVTSSSNSSGGVSRADATVANEFEFDYGNEFDEVTDETELSRLIC